MTDDDDRRRGMGCLGYGVLVFFLGPCLWSFLIAPTIGGVATSPAPLVEQRRAHEEARRFTERGPIARSGEAPPKRGAPPARPDGSSEASPALPDFTAPSAAERIRQYEVFVGAIAPASATAAEAAELAAMDDERREALLTPWACDHTGRVLAHERPRIIEGVLVAMRAGPDFDASSPDTTAVLTLVTGHIEDRASWYGAVVVDRNDRIMWYLRPK